MYTQGQSCQCQHRCPSILVLVVLVPISLVEIEYLCKPEAVAHPRWINGEIHEFQKHLSRNRLASHSEDHTFHVRCDRKCWWCQTISWHLKGTLHWACQGDCIGARHASWAAGGQLCEWCKNVLHFF